MCLPAVPALLTAVTIGSQVVQTMQQMSAADAQYEQDKLRQEAAIRQHQQEVAMRQQEQQLQYSQIAQQQSEVNDQAVAEKGDIAREARAVKARIAAAQADSGLQVGQGSNFRTLAAIGFEASRQTQQVEANRANQIAAGQKRFQAAHLQAQVADPFILEPAKPNHGLTILGGALGVAGSALNRFDQRRSPTFGTTGRALSGRSS